MERWKKERDRVAAVVDEFRTHCQTNKATKWEETLLNALRQSSQTMSAIAVQLEQHKEKLNRHATPTVVTPPGASPATPIATSLGSVVLAEFYSDHRIELCSNDNFCSFQIGQYGEQRGHSGIRRKKFQLFRFVHQIQEETHGQCIHFLIENKPRDLKLKFCGIYFRAKPCEV